jgi:hypothetical protein
LHPCGVLSLLLSFSRARLLAPHFVSARSPLSARALSLSLSPSLSLSAHMHTHAHNQCART